MKKPKPTSKQGTIPKRKPKIEDTLDYHEGMTENQVRIVLHEFGLNYDKFSKWMVGQTCPILRRYVSGICIGGDGVEPIIQHAGVYEYDLFRYIRHHRRGAPLIFD